MTKVYLATSENYYIGAKIKMAFWKNKQTPVWHS